MFSSSFSPPNTSSKTQTPQDSTQDAPSISTPTTFSSLFDPNTAKKKQKTIRESPGQNSSRISIKDSPPKAQRPPFSRIEQWIQKSERQSYFRSLLKTSIKTSLSSGLSEKSQSMRQKFLADCLSVENKGEFRRRKEIDEFMTIAQLIIQDVSQYPQNYQQLISNDQEFSQIILNQDREGLAICLKRRKQERQHQIENQKYIIMIKANPFKRNQAGDIVSRDGINYTIIESFYFSATLKQRFITILIDCQSPTSTITLGLAKKIKILPLKHLQATPSNTNFINKVFNVPIIIKKKKILLNFCVVKQARNGIILGADMLQRYECSFDYTHNALMFYGNLKVNCFSFSDEVEVKGQGKAKEEKRETETETWVEEKDDQDKEDYEQNDEKYQLFVQELERERIREEIKQRSWKDIQESFTFGSTNKTVNQLELKQSQ